MKILRTIADFYLANKIDCDYFLFTLICFCVVLIPYGITRIIARRR